jgi:hypothetical protein
LIVEARSITRPLLMLLCLGGTALGLNNTYGDDTELKALAEKTACGSPQCSVKMLNEHRSAFSAGFGYQTSLVQKGKTDRSASADVECRRTYYLLGEYHCALVSGGLPDAPASH